MTFDLQKPNSDALNEDFIKIHLELFQFPTEQINTKKGGQHSDRSPDVYLMFTWSLPGVFCLSRPPTQHKQEMVDGLT